MTLLFHASGGRESAAEGEAPALTLAAERPEIAVIDYAMPGMDGAQTAEQLRRLMPQLPIILASGQPDTASIERALGGHATVLRKPFGVLSDTMTRMLAAGADRRRLNGPSPLQEAVLFKDVRRRSCHLSVSGRPVRHRGSRDETTARPGKGGTKCQTITAASSGTS